AVAILPIFRAADPVLLKVTVWAALVVPTSWLANVRLAGNSPAAGAIPLPLRATVCGLPLALSVTDSVPVRMPVAVGLKLTLMLQLAPLPKLALQSFTSLYRPAVAILLIFRVADPVLLNFTL